MRLKCIRLAGFKSFVDPTTVSFPSNMAAVVGPNGCGKSNIIDAVRWVMGESSAKNLRGESMTDVIFNGSNSRKPVGQASIELVFDNSAGTLQGAYAAFAEISIRRKVTREGQNSYYLNNVKCRRRDITDIFLGTGLGPRSYSIIEQGMISKLIEARPEDLRNFIEEAAGISRYKERRRETENRIRRTQDNLARLTDLRDELERQLERLQRQAQAAEKYQQHKAEERLLQAQLLALRWQALNAQAGGREQQIAGQELALEAQIAEQRNADACIEQLRDAHHELSEQFNQAQGRFYSVGADIARIEQSLQHAQQRLRQLQADLAEAERSREETERHLREDRELLALLDEQLQQLLPEQALLEATGEQLGDELQQAEAQLQDWQEQWDSFTQHSAAPRRQAEVQQAHIAQLERSLEQLTGRQQRLREETGQLQADQPRQQLDTLAGQLADSELEVERLQASAALQGEQLHQQRLLLQTSEQQRQALLGEWQQRAGRIASLEALQQAALDPDNGVAEWLAQQQLADRPRLLQHLRVEPGWEQAVETVLGGDLQALLAGPLDAPDYRGLSRGSLCLLDLPAAQPAATGSLLDKVESDVDLSPWLATVSPVESLEQALARRGSLADGQSLISRDGYWVGRHFVRLQRGNDSQGSVLARAGELEQLQLSQQQAEQQLEALEQRCAELQQVCRQLEAQREQQQRHLQDAVRAQGTLQAQLSALQARAEQLALRQLRLQEEQQELALHLAEQQEQLGEARLLLQASLEAMASDSDRRELLLAAREGLREGGEQRRQAVRQQQDQAHQLAMRQESLRTRQQATAAALQRLETQAMRAGERQQQLQLDMEEGGAPQDELRLQLEEQLERRMQAEEQLHRARQALAEVDQQLRDNEQRRSQAEQQAQQLRSQLEQQRLDWQGLDVRRSTLVEQLAADGQDLHALLQALPAEASDALWVQQLEQLAARISRLGPINLAAIDEYRQQAERKRYLDAQNDDLSEALETLENVIRKIDRETRNRFKDTFEQINAGLQALFPKVFGGGEAYLELTGEDLLDTGVAIMARPPGKKNSTIHLLSGGEKALTALALVFAIFQLNPAPFCMLDEVDAPLDDANVGRYARLVKDMSATVQFIYITHNKIAMEMADQLMGVTMHEPGCSRLVAVDVEEALTLVES